MRGRKGIAGGKAQRTPRVTPAMRGRKVKQAQRLELVGGGVTPAMRGRKKRCGRANRILARRVTPAMRGRKYS